jgi:predicted amidohydrolase YtcJ
MRVGGLRRQARTHLLRRKKEVGAIEAGKLADLIMVSQNIFEVEPKNIHKTTSILTMVGGRIVFDAR